MINYTPSALDSNETLLQALHRIEKYLKINPIYKVYAVDANYSADTQQYDLTDIVASESTLAEGDVVFFKNNIYAYVSAVGSEVFSVSNASLFKGEQGERGLQGEQGQAGADGKTGLQYNFIIQSSSVPVANASIALASGNFNRTPLVNEYVTCFVNHLTTNDVYLVCGYIESVVSSIANLKVQQVFLITGQNGEDGAQGEAGEIALIYDKTLSFTKGSGTSQLVDVSLAFEDFSREPKPNEDFIALLYDSTSQLQYIAQCEVQTKSSTAVTQIVASDIVRLTGQNGANGKDALYKLNTLSSLVAGDPYHTSKNISIHQNNVLLWNRIPVAGDCFYMYYHDIPSSKYYFLGCTVTSVSEVNNNVVAYVEESIDMSPQVSSGKYLHKIVGSVSSGSTLYNYVINIIDETSTPYDTPLLISQALKNYYGENVWGAGNMAGSNSGTTGVATLCRGDGVSSYFQWLFNGSGQVNTNGGTITDTVVAL